MKNEKQLIMNSPNEWNWIGFINRLVFNEQDFARGADSAQSNRQPRDGIRGSAHRIGRIRTCLTQLFSHLDKFDCLHYW
jgi:hypothetical protein